MRLFLDANVLIDFMGERIAYYPQAATLFSFAAEQNVRLRYPRCLWLQPVISVVREERCHCHYGPIRLMQ